MSLIPYRKTNTFGALEDLHDEIDKLFFAPFARGLNKANEFTPALVDIAEDKDNIYVDLDTPGFDKKDIKINLKSDILTISGKKENKTEEKDKHYHRIERFSGSFLRQIPLTSAVDRSKVKASYKDGVLKLVLGKKEEAKEKDIDINVE